MPIRRTSLTQDDLTWMRRAVDAGKRSQNEPGRYSPLVGAVVVRDGKLLAESFRGMTGSGDHAEYGALKGLQDIDLVGASVYTTLEPCTRRGEGKIPCAERLVAGKVGTVYIGMYDPDPRVYCEGWRRLHDAGVTLRDFDRALREEIHMDNADFIGQFRHTVGLQGRARFDYTLNDGRFSIYADNARVVQFQTRWTPCGKDHGTGCVYAYDHVFNVAYARHRTELDQIDDPSALAFDSYTCPVKEGEIVIFRNDHGYALVKVTSVLAGKTWGDDRTELCFDYELRLADVDLSAEVPGPEGSSVSS